MESKIKYIKTKVLDVEINTIIDGGFFQHMITGASVHEHSSFEAQICIDGKFDIETEKKNRVTLYPGEILLMPSGCYHSTISSTEKADRVVVKFMINRETQSDYLAPLVNLRHPITVNGGELLGKIMSMVIDELRENSIGTEEMIKSLLDMFYIALIRIINPEAENKNDLKDEEILDSYGERGYKMEQFFGLNHMKEVTPEDLGKELGLSTRQVNRMLNKTYKMSFREKLIDVRIHAAEGMLLSTDLTIEKIGASVGYSSPSGFGVAFKKKYGLSPASYRKKYKI